MNKQELIEKYKLQLKDRNPFGELVSHDLIVSIFLDDLKQLDEPQKVTIPQFVADWIEKAKQELSLRDLMSKHYVSFEVDSWLAELDEDGDFINQETFTRAVLDGYTVEKEPKYTVKYKATKQYLSNDEIGPHFDPNFRSNFTKSDLEKLGLGWVFGCEGMEVDKVGK